MLTAYFDCFSGASGDMILGALIDAGLSIDHLRDELGKLRLSHYHIDCRQVVKRGIGGTQAVVNIDGDYHGHHHRHLKDIREIIESSALDRPIKEKSVDIFTRLAEAEAKVHRTSVEHIHFHEVGAMDAIVDVVGTVAGLSLMGVERITCSPLHLGSGTIRCAHGILPVPAPATAELVTGKPVYSTGVEGELLTPTGAAILTTLASDFGPMPFMDIKYIGYGAGNAEPPIPNLLRIFIGEVRDGASGYLTERVAVLETNIDDMNPQLYDYLIQSILDMGARDVFLTPLQMKKNRPGIKMTVICPHETVGQFSDFLLQETTSIGLRWRVENRIKAHRSIVEIPTRYGVVRFKVAEACGRVVNVAPEYEDCKRIAREKGIPLKEVMEEARSEAKAADLMKRGCTGYGSGD